jgi:hypothetical protein
LPGELGILLCGFVQSEAVELRIDFDRRHRAIILRSRHFSRGSVLAK